MGNLSLADISLSISNQKHNILYCVNSVFLGRQELQVLFILVMDAYEFVLLNHMKLKKKML